MKHRCPICKKPTDSTEHVDFPFCSERCRLLDLGAWASERYVVSDPVFDEEEILEADRPTQQKGRHEPDETIQ
ncbi:MAG TPA: DNA gyrase inhibitor YacG [Terracidiphilus sp.]|nr:DNA gyrase inhibitor YacG [Terracidiphilus sp.]